MLEGLLRLLTVHCHQGRSHIIVGVDVLVSVVERVVVREIQATFPFNIAQKSVARLVRSRLACITLQPGLLFLGSGDRIVSLGRRRVEEGLELLDDGRGGACLPLMDLLGWQSLLEAASKALEIEILREDAHGTLGSLSLRHPVMTLAALRLGKLRPLGLQCSPEVLRREQRMRQQRWRPALRRPLASRV